MTSGTIAYAIVCVLFTFNFVASVFMVHIVVSKLYNMNRVLYYWIFAALSAEGMIALASFFPLVAPNEVISGVPIATWLNAVYAAAIATLYCWVVVFHLSTKRWVEK